MRDLRRFASDVRQARVELVRPGESALPGRRLWGVGRVALTLLISGINLVGACAVLAVASFVVPLPTVPHVSAGHIETVNAIVAAAYVLVAIPLGTWLGTRRTLGLRKWMAEERPATPEEQRLVLRAPLRLFTVQITLWLGAAVLFGAINSTYSGALALRVAGIVAITGFTTGVCAYLVTERVLRSPAVRMLAHGAPDRLAAPGVATRAMLAWALGSGLPVLGLVTIGIAQLAGDSATRHQLAITIVVLGGIGLTVGLLAVGLAARATADPIDDVRDALGQVRRGDFDVRVPVYDGSQVGQLQLGFNLMAEGLAERERIREAFGTYVDPDVAERVLIEGTSLEGEDVEVTAMFIDVRNFTGFAESRPAREVVATINRLFERIVPIIHAHGGRVDKFIGDGLLAVFGAPRRQPDHADEALAAALEIARAVQSDDSELEIGIGLNSGPVVAGNVGAAGRLEFSVIGDAVNVAARVEAATRQTGDAILLTEATASLLSDSHQVDLVERPGIELKGKSEPLRLYAVAE